MVTLSTRPPAPQLALFANPAPESKSEARVRARELVRLHGMIAEIPEERDEHQSWVLTLDYFIGKGSAGIMSVDDWDGCIRDIGDLDECVELTAKDRRAIAKDKEHWKPIPKGWMGIDDGRLYYTAMHSKELAFLQEWRDEMQARVDGLGQVLIETQAELEQLKAVGQLPEHVANQYHLTLDGDKAVQLNG